MENLIQKISEYKKATQNLLTKVDEYENFIKENIPYELWGKFGLGTVGEGTQFEREYIKINGKLVPSKPYQFGKGLYYANDYNYWYDYVTSKELVEWSQNLPYLIEKAEIYISDITEKANAVNV